MAGMLCLLSACGRKTGMIASENMPSVIAFGTDLHAGTKETEKGAVNPLENYNEEIIKAFLSDVQESTDVLVLCGDLTNAGREEQHKQLIRELKEAEKNGLQIFVLPGNHDMERISTEQFAKLYDQFGYSEAYDRDDSSLSYSAVLGDLMLVMIDTGGYVNRKNYVSMETVEWVRRQFVTAEEKGWRILPVGHYPLVSQEAGTDDGRGALKQLMLDHEIPLYICGHLHGWRMADEDCLSELVVGQTTGYPCTYVSLDLNESGYRFENIPVDVEQWAFLNDVWNTDLLSFNEYQKRLHEDACRETIGILAEKKDCTEEELKLAEQFYILFTDCRTEGTVYEHRDELYAHPGYEIMLKLGEGNVYGRWVPQLLDQAVPYHYDIPKKD